MSERDNRFDEIAHQFEENILAVKGTPQLQMTNSANFCSRQLKGWMLFRDYLPIRLSL